MAVRCEYQMRSLIHGVGDSVSARTSRRTKTDWRRTITRRYDSVIGYEHDNRPTNQPTSNIYNNIFIFRCVYCGHHIKACQCQREWIVDDDDSAAGYRMAFRWPKHVQRTHMKFYYFIPVVLLRPATTSNQPLPIILDKIHIARQHIDTKASHIA